MSQTSAGKPPPPEIRRRHAAWNAHPHVQRFTRECTAQAHRENLQFTAEGLTRTFAIAREWIAANGDLPDSGLHAWG